MNRTHFTLTDQDIRRDHGISLHTIRHWRRIKAFVGGKDYIYTGEGIRYRDDIKDHKKIKDFKPRRRK